MVVFACFVEAYILLSRRRWVSFEEPF
ncbi:unnamed protein product [Victoria cruziana]